MKSLIILKPKLYITPLAEAKMASITRLSKGEVAWHGYTERPSADLFIIKDILLFPQEVSSATVTSDEDAYTKWYIDHFDEFDRIRFHGHSHVNMSVSPSSTDMTYREEMLKGMNGSGYYIFLIRNKKGEKEIQIYDYDTGAVYDEDDIEVLYQDPSVIAEAEEWVVNETANYVTERTYKKCSTTLNRWNSSTQPISKDPCTSLGLEQWEDEWLNYSYGQDSSGYTYGTWTE